MKRITKVMSERRDELAKQMITEGAKNMEIVAATRKRFGAGINLTKIAEFRREGKQLFHNYGAPLTEAEKAPIPPKPMVTPNQRPFIRTETVPEAPPIATPQCDLISDIIKAGFKVYVVGGELEVRK